MTAKISLAFQKSRQFLNKQRCLLCWGGGVSFKTQQKTNMELRGPLGTYSGSGDPGSIPEGNYGM